MTMKFGSANVKFDNYEAKRNAYADVVKNTNATAEDKATAFGEMMDALGSDAQEYIQKQVDAKTDEFINMKAADQTLTPEDIKFYNEVKTDTDTKGSADIIMPESTVDRIFDDMVQAHPLLQEIGLKNNGIRLKFLSSEQSGAAVWGKFTGDIQGQLDAKFSEEKATQSKLTAYVVLPNDLLDFGPSYLKTYISTQIREAFGEATESAYLSGDGADKPIGLDRDISKGAADSNGVVTYPQKASFATLTFANTKTAAKEVAKVINELSTNAAGKPVVARGNTVFVMNPGEHMLLEAQFAIQNVNGQFVTSYPFGIRVIDSIYQTPAKATVFVKGRYDAYEAGSLNIKAFDQTLALEDAMLYTAKQFFYGKARDNKAALVIDLDLQEPGTTTTTPTTGGDAGDESGTAPKA